VVPPVQLFVCQRVKWLKRNHCLPGQGRYTEMGMSTGHLPGRMPNFGRRLNIRIATLYNSPSNRMFAESRRMSKKLNLDALSVDEMWQLHEEINSLLSIRLTAEKRELEKRLAQLRREKESRKLESTDRQTNDPPRERRKYPRVFAKYRNPNEPSETWSGRGKQPRWLSAALKSGHTIDEFVIQDGESNESNLRRRRA
jgi:DNA-binding protein H-NS